jgi:hypothetical protein
VGLALPGVALAAVIVTIDQQGANDEPGQKDLTRFTIDDASPPGHLLVSFNHDEIGFNGSNTGDGCFLFDTDANGMADYALCATIGGNPATLQSTRLFSCGDTSSFKCTNPQTQINTFASTCSASQTNTDPFPTGADFPQDTTTACDISLADFGSGASLLDVCSYPSQQPNSDPSDCVLHARQSAVTLRGFDAHRTARGVVLRWRTGAETDTLGFAIYRQWGAKKVQVNTATIAAANALAGHAYGYVDRHAPHARVRYWLEAINRSGAHRVLASTIAS